MTTARRLIYEGYREGNVIPANVLLTASDVQNAEALPLLNGIVLTMIGEVIGAEPQDWPIPPQINATTTPYWNKDPRENPAAQQPSRGFNGSNNNGALYPPVNSRLVLAVDNDPVTVFLPPSPDDGALIMITDLNSTAIVTLDANGRFIDDASTKVLDPVSSFNGTLFMYHADDANWRSITAMGIDDESPLPEAFNDLLSIQLYFRVAPRYGSTPSAETAMTYKLALAKLKKRYRIRQPLRAPAKGPRNAIQEYSGTFNNRR